MIKNSICSLLVMCGSLTAYTVFAGAYMEPQETMTIQAEEQQDFGDWYEPNNQAPETDDERQTQETDNNQQNTDGLDEGPIIGDEDTRPKER